MDVKHIEPFPAMFDPFSLKTLSHHLTSYPLQVLIFLQSILNFAESDIVWDSIFQSSFMPPLLDSFVLYFKHFCPTPYCSVGRFLILCQFSADLTDGDIDMTFQNQLPLSPDNSVGFLKLPLWAIRAFWNTASCVRHRLAWIQINHSFGKNTTQRFTAFTMPQPIQED